MTNMSIQPLWLTYFIEILLVLESNSQSLILAHFLIRPILDPKFPLMALGISVRNRIGDSTGEFLVIVLWGFLSVFSVLELL